MGVGRAGWRRSVTWRRGTGRAGVRPWRNGRATGGTARASMVGGAADERPGRAAGVQEARP